MIIFNLLSEGNFDFFKQIHPLDHFPHLKQLKILTHQMLQNDSVYGFHDKTPTNLIKLIFTFGTSIVN